MNTGLCISFAEKLTSLQPLSPFATNKIRQKADIDTIYMNRSGIVALRLGKIKNR
jgi:hypothetical protein